MLVQVPWLPDRLHALQAPLQALLQQTPSTQNPLEHWLFPEQLAPFDCLGAQVVPLQ
jgi:hypothetical protein